MKDKLKIDPSLAELLEHQQNISDTESQRETLQEAIAAQEAILASTSPPQHNIEELESRLEELRADQALGVDCSEELIATEEAIKKIRTDLQTHDENTADTIKASNHALVGLRRRLARITEELAALKMQKNPKLHAFIMSEAERIGAEYVEVANKLASRHAQLLALHTVLSGLGQGIFNNYSVSIPIEIPLFNLKAHHGHNHPSVHGQLKAPHDNGSDQSKSAALTAERNRLKALGAEL